MNLTAFLRQNAVEFEFLEKHSTHHASEASDSTGIALDRIVKTIVFIDHELNPLLAIVRADRSVSRHKLQHWCGSKSVRIATTGEAERATGYPTGGIPPVGHKRRLPAYLDEELFGVDYVWCGGGTRTRLVKLPVADILRLATPTTCDIRT
ncbi:MAG: aminoacyl-tRNA deacylase [Chloroflexota bacterium]